jgi:CRISPR-associated protein Cas2
MGQTTLLYLIAYDIREPKRWRRAYRILRGYGRPVQYSLFRCRLGAVEFERLRWELERVLDSEDALLFVGLCSGCVERITSRNRKNEWQPEPGKFRLV